MAMLPPDPVYIFKGEMAPVTSLTFKITPFLQYIYAATQSGKIHIWDLQVSVLKILKQKSNTMYY